MLFDDYYLNTTSNECLLCAKITHCLTCSPTETLCTKCNAEYISKGDKCELCLPTHYKYSETECAKCSSLFP